MPDRLDERGHPLRLARSSRVWGRPSEHGADDSRVERDVPNVSGLAHRRPELQRARRKSLKETLARHRSAGTHDPVLHSAVTRVRQGASREQALIAAVRAFSEQVAMLKAAKVDALHFGNGFVTVTHLSGEFSYRRLDPASVVIYEPK